jgi:hypothetical protein
VRWYYNYIDWEVSMSSQKKSVLESFVLFYEELQSDAQPAARIRRPRR